MSYVAQAGENKDSEGGCGQLGPIGGIMEEECGGLLALMYFICAKMEATA